MEWHDFEIESPLEWSRSFHADSLELCLNFAGDGRVRRQANEMAFGPLSAGFYLPSKGGLQANRSGGQRHRFLTVEFSAGFLREKLLAHDGALNSLRGRIAAQRKIQCYGGGAGSGLFKPQPFQPRFLPDHGLLSHVVSFESNRPLNNSNAAAASQRQAD